jgi:two-component sensor histidine kinase/CHASE3 domain sensor protein
MLRVRLFFGISVFLLLGSSLALVLTLRDIERSSNLLGNCYRAISTADSMLSTLKDTESGQRGFMLTGQMRYLAPLIPASPRVRNDLAQLRSLAVDNAKKRHLPQLEALVETWLAELRGTMEQARSTGRAGPMRTVMMDAGGETMDGLRSTVDGFDKNERTVLVKRTQALQSEEQRALIIAFATAFGVASTALIAAFRVFRREQRTEKVLAGALENIVEGRNALTESERQLTDALAHEKVIVRELHHRVKNNLQMITSLLQLRARRRGGETAAELEGVAGRMRALALVQAHVYRTDSFDRVDFAATLSDIAEQIVAGHGDDNIALVRDFDGPLDLNVVRAVPLGLVCHEMMFNAMQHAWPENRRGTLHVSLRTRSTPPEIEISDDGAGFVPQDARQGFGALLLRTLSGEARATVDIDSRPGAGTTVILRLS